jgi:hypothetical protein
MTTINREFNRIESAIDRALTSHRERLICQQEQIKCLTQLLDSRRNGSLDPHCVSAIDRLTTALAIECQATDRVYSVLTSLTQAKDAPNLTIDRHGDLVTSLQLELDKLAQRLGIDAAALFAAAYTASIWANLMAAHPDADGYQWQFPSAKRSFGFYRKTKLQAIGTKSIEIAPGTPLN